MIKDTSFSDSGIAVFKVEFVSLVEAFLPDDDTDAEEAEDHDTNDDPHNDTSVFKSESSKLSGSLSQELDLQCADGSLCNCGCENNINGFSDWDHNFTSFTNC